jgi:hypothetical protein
MVICWPTACQQCICELPECFYRRPSEAVHCVAATTLDSQHCTPDGGSPRHGVNWHPCFDRPPTLALVVPVTKPWGCVTYPTVVSCWYIFTVSWCIAAWRRRKCSLWVSMAALHYLNACCLHWLLLQSLFIPSCVFGPSRPKLVLGCRHWERMSVSCTSPCQICRLWTRHSARSVLLHWSTIKFFQSFHPYPAWMWKFCGFMTRLMWRDVKITNNLVFLMSSFG